MLKYLISGIVIFALFSLYQDLNVSSSICNSSNNHSVKLVYDKGFDVIDNGIYSECASNAPYLTLVISSDYINETIYYTSLKSKALAQSFIEYKRDLLYSLANRFLKN